MKKLSLALGVGWILCAVQACGSAEENAPAEPAEFSSSVPGDETLESLSASEVEAVCRDTDEFMLRSGLPTETCQVFGALAAARAALISPDTSDDELRTICSDSYEGCSNDEAVTGDSCARNGFSETCAASVTEYGACLEARAREFHRLAQELPRCTTLTRKRLNETSLEDPDFGSDCETYRAKCPDISKAAADFVAGYCERISPCCSEAKLGDDCQALTIQAVQGKHFDATAAEDCVARLEQYQADPDYCSVLGQSSYASQWSAAIPACEGVFSGSSDSVAVPAGAPCTVEEDCASPASGIARCAPLVIIPDAYPLDRICVPVTKADLGDPCLGTIAETYGMYTEWVGDITGAGGALCPHSENLRCDGQTGTCIAARDLGDACSSTLECALDAYCDPDGVCAARLVEGAPCNDLFGACAGEAECDDTSERCTLPLPAGAACSEHGDGMHCAALGCVDSVCSDPLAPLCGAR